MKRWKSSFQEVMENKAIDIFLTEIIAVSKKHGFSISHEDGQGAFMVTEYTEGNSLWLWNAQDDTEG